MNAERDNEARGFAIRLFTAAVAAQELFTCYLGLKLGLYQALSHEDLTAADLAARAGTAERYTREWLEQQAAAGILIVHDASAPATERSYSLPAGHAEALLAPDSPYSVASIAVLPMGATGPVLAELISAFRSGAGIPYTAYGEDSRDGHAGSNRALFTHYLPDWVRSALPDVHNRLLVGGRVADVGCGAGWSSIALAKAYPDIEVHGYDLDEQSVADARRNAKESGMSDRVTFQVRDCAGPSLSGRYNLVCVFDALHDMSRPVDVLRSCRALLATGAPMLVMDAKVAEQFTAPAGEVERFLYAASVLHCLPVGLSEQPSAGTGTAMRPATVAAYAEEAGFTGTQVLPVEDMYHRFYRLNG